jgi:ribonuclease Z
MRAWEEAESHAYQFQFFAAEPGQEYPLKDPYFFIPFPTSHRVPSQGYTVYERRKRLRPELAGLSRDELLAQKRAGVELDLNYSEALISFTGDTRIEFLDLAPEVAKSRILVMEVTFYDEQKTVENARYWGHIHLDELIPRLDSIRAERIVLIHASARYTSKQIREILDAKVPEQHKSRIALFPRPT